MTDQPKTAEARIIAAAILLPGGKVTLSVNRPGRHHDIFRKARDCGVSLAELNGTTQGFLTSDGRFVTRVQAVRIARDAGQILVKTPPEHELFSEDVW